MELPAATLPPLPFVFYELFLAKLASCCCWERARLRARRFLQTCSLVVVKLTFHYLIIKPHRKQSKEKFFGCIQKKKKNNVENSCLSRSNISIQNLLFYTMNQSYDLRFSKFLVFRKEYQYVIIWNGVIDIQLYERELIFFSVIVHFFWIFK